ncbi:site-2 protease family protein, partial [Pantoea sp. SIMBA_133]
RIVAVNVESINSWFELVEFIRNAPEHTLQVTIERNGAEQAVSVTPEARAEESGESIGFVGAGVEAISWPEEVLRDVSYGPFAAVPVALSETWA